MTIDPFILSGASLGAAWRAERGGAAGAVYHVIGGGPLPIASGLPVVATLLDVAPWEMPDAFQQSVAGRFGHRLRGQLLRDAAAVIVGTDSRRPGRPPAAPHPTRPAPRGRHRGATAVRGPTDQAVRARGRRSPRPAWRRRPLPRVHRAVRRPPRSCGPPRRPCRRSPRRDRPADLPAGVPWPPLVVLAGASPDDRASIARAAARHGHRHVARLCPGAPGRGAGRARASALVPPSCRSCRRPPGCRSSRPSPPERRWSRPRSGRCPSSSAGPGCWWNPADPAPPGHGPGHDLGR